MTQQPMRVDQPILPRDSHVTEPVEIKCLAGHFDSTDVYLVAGYYKWYSKQGTGLVYEVIGPSESEQ